MNSMASRLTIRPGVGAIIRDEGGAFLLHRRRVGGGWAPVSGGVEPGEDVIAALHREVAEETGLAVGVRRLLAIHSDPATQIVTYPDGRRVHYVTCVFECLRKGGDFRGSNEGLEWCWFAPQDMPRDLTPYAVVWLRDALTEGAGVLVR